MPFGNKNRVGSRLFRRRLLLGQLGLTDIDGGCVESGFQVSRIVLLDHFHARSTVLSDLVDVGALHEPEADVAVTQTVRRAPASVAEAKQVAL
jgi:hypothetical protein